MLFRDVINLITVSYTQNTLGDDIETETLRQVFANEKGVTRDEFYQAQGTGLKPSIIFEINKFDYQDEQKLEHDGKKYNIIRTYPVKGENIELICEGLVK